MNRLKKNLFISLLMLVSSCKNDKNEYYNLPAQWKSSLAENDTLIYTTSSLIMDTVVVIRKFPGQYKYALSGTSCKGPYAYFETECIYLDRLSNSPFTNCLSKSGFQYFGECTSGVSCHALIQIEVGMRDIGRKDDRDFSPTIFWKDKFVGNYVYTKSDTTINHTKYFNIYVYKPMAVDSLSKIVFNHQTDIIAVEFKKGYSISFLKKSNP